MKPGGETVEQIASFHQMCIEAAEIFWMGCFNWFHCTIPSCIFSVFEYNDWSTVCVGMQAVGVLQEKNYVNS